MKRFIAVLLLAAMALSSCTSAGGGSSETSGSTVRPDTSTALTTTDERVIPTDTIPATIPATDDPITVPTTEGSDTPVTEQTPTTSVTVTDTPVTDAITTDFPVTDAPVTAAPVTVATTTAPVTNAPTTTVPPSVTDAPHTHSYGAWTTIKSATCVAEGSQTRTCSCGEKDTRTLAAIGHKWTAWTQTKEPTLDAEGERARSCSTCQTKETGKVAKVAPTFYNLFPIDNASRATLISSTAGGFNDSETAASLFDSAPYTKLCTANTGYTIEWKLDKVARIYGYSIMNGNDSSTIERRLTAWTLEASNNGTDWTTVSTVNNANLAKENYAEKLFALDMPGNYQYFRFTLKDQMNDQTQMAEISLFTNEIPQTPALKDRLVSDDQLDDSANMVAGLELVRRTINDYHNFEYNTVGEQPGYIGATTLWPATSLLEAVAEAYRICPDDPYIYSAYVDLLNHVLGTYRVEATITTPNRGSFDVVYYNASANNSGDYYYDDDAWVCIQFLLAYDLLGDERYLEMAEESLKFLWTGWDDVLGGGIYWDKTYQSKNTCADGPIAIAFLRAYEITKKEDYLEKGKMIYEWLRAVMLETDPTNGEYNLYYDAINIDGSYNRWKAAYNQGTPIAAGALLYHITGDQKYYDETTAVWRATINHMFRGSGSNTTMNGNPIFKAWCVGWLVRGFEMYYMVDDAKQTTAMDKMLSVLEDERATYDYTFNTYYKDGRVLRTDTLEGYYDPYFCTGDWEVRYDPNSTNSDERNPEKNVLNKKEILQPSGVATTFLLAGFYELSLN